MKEEIARVRHHSSSRHFKVLWVDLNADTVASPSSGGEVGRPRSHERVEHGVTDEAKHPDESLRERSRERCRVFIGG